MSSRCHSSICPLCRQRWPTRPSKTQLILLEGRSRSSGLGFPLLQGSAVGTLHVPASRPVSRRRLHADPRRESLSASPAMGHEPGARVVHTTSLERRGFDPCKKKASPRAGASAASGVLGRSPAAQGEDLGGTPSSARSRGRELQGVLGAAVLASIGGHGHTRAPLDVAHLGDFATLAGKWPSGAPSHRPRSPRWLDPVPRDSVSPKHSTKYDRGFRRVRSTAAQPGAVFVEPLSQKDFPGTPLALAGLNAPDAPVATSDPREIEAAPADRAGAILDSPDGSSLRGFLGRGSRSFPLPVRLSRRIHPPLCGSAPRCSGWADSPARSSPICCGISENSRRRAPRSGTRSGTGWRSPSITAFRPGFWTGRSRPTSRCISRPTSAASSPPARPAKTGPSETHDGVVWCVDFRRLHHDVPSPLRRALDREKADLFTSEMLDARAPRLEDLARLARPRRPYAVFLDPPSLDQRMTNQFSVFSCLSDPDTELLEVLDRHPDSVRRVVIPAALRTEVRDKLDQANVTERVLFPGLDGLARWLARYYTPRDPAKGFAARAPRSRARPRSRGRISGPSG